ncbi:hypothetical protein [Paenibacillus sp. 1001270B_150601_E10]|uniref:hypothetical protein n=1 Tax=Paenibacillus sp. 1001270B_150601_E10 TaxID=2787079 RepID=UPI0018A09987|nr:hypothetical protein [Paenibacillus sp. 1001270B_150601_E10]
MDVSVESLKLSSADAHVKQWFEENAKSNGIYLAKSNDSVFYLYMKYLDPVSVSMVTGKNSMTIDTKQRKSNQSDRDGEYKDLFCMKIKEKLLNRNVLDKIVLNGQVIKTSSIPVLTTPPK